MWYEVERETPPRTVDVAHQKDYHAYRNQLKLILITGAVIVMTGMLQVLPVLR